VGHSRVLTFFSSRTFRCKNSPPGLESTGFLRPAVTLTPHGRKSYSGYMEGREHGRTPKKGYCFFCFHAYRAAPATMRTTTMAIARYGICPVVATGVASARAAVDGVVCGVAGAVSGVKSP